MLDQQKTHAPPFSGFTDGTLKYVAETGKIFNTARMCQAEQPTVERGIEDACAALRPVRKDRRAVSIGVVDETFAIDEEQMRNMSPPAKQLANLLAKGRDERFEITKALALGEFTAFEMLIASQNETL